MQRRQARRRAADHLHSDHLVDLYQLIVSGWHQNRTVPQRIYGPKGTHAYVEGLPALWREERMAHERRHGPRPA